MITSRTLRKYLDEYVSNPKCELEYSKDYELLMATVLSARCTDKRVNMVTRKLFSKYNIYDIKDLNLKELEEIIKPVGSYTKKAYYLKSIATDLVLNFEGTVPNNREYLESLPGVGRKTCNVVLANLYNVPAIAVDTHVERVSKRLGIADGYDSPLEVEKKLMKLLPKNKWSRVHHQMVLFGRYKCKSISPDCTECKFKKYCNYKYKNESKKQK